MTIAEGVKEQAKRATVVRLCLGAALFVDVVAVVCGGMQRSLLATALATGELDPGAAAANDSRMALAGWLQLALVVVTAVTWLRWQHRAYSNLTLAGTRETEYTPRWSIGYWFVPIVNIVRPYQITVELWLRSTTGNRDKRLRGEYTPGIVGLWWGAWVASGILGRMFQSLSRDARPDQLISLTGYGMVLDLLGAATAALAIIVVTSIAREQRNLVPIPVGAVGEATSPSTVTGNGSFPTLSA